LVCKFESFLKNKVLEIEGKMVKRQVVDGEGVNTVCFLTVFHVVMG